MDCLAGLFCCFHPSSSPPPSAPSHSPPPIPTTDAPATAPAHSVYPSELDRPQAFWEQHWFPAAPGVVFLRRYRLIGKLGFGATATAWLARDDRSDRDGARYVVAKILTIEASIFQNPEVTAVQHMKDLGVDLVSSGIRYPIDELDRPLTMDSEAPYHTIMIHEPTGPDVYTALQKYPNRQMPLEQVKRMVKQLLQQLSFLHKVGVMHLDLHCGNVLCGLKNAEETFAAFEAAEEADPAKCLNDTDNSKVVYASREVDWELSGDVILADLGQAALFGPGVTRRWLDKIPDPMRPPEVALNCYVDEKADIWQLGHLVWLLVCGRELVSYGKKFGRKNGRLNHVRWLLSILGRPDGRALDWHRRHQDPEQPPVNFRHLAEVIEAGGVPVDSVPYSGLEQALEIMRPIEDDEERVAFLKFLRRMLLWIPGDRASADELADDCWLNSEDPDVEGIQAP